MQEVVKLVALVLYGRNIFKKRSSGNFCQLDILGLLFNFSEFWMCMFSRSRNSLLFLWQVGCIRTPPPLVSVKSCSKRQKTPKARIKAFFLLLLVAAIKLPYWGYTCQQFIVSSCVTFYSQWGCDGGWIVYESTTPGGVEEEGFCHCWCVTIVFAWDHCERC